jgi:hypothetical protein
MRNFILIKTVMIGVVFSMFLLTGSALAQNQIKEYRDWQRAQAKAQQEHNDYLRTRSARDYNQWRAAERRVQEQYRQYQAAVNRNTYRNGYNNRYYNNSYTNNGYNTNLYRVYPNGTYYSVDARGAEMLRQAVRNGYSRGYNDGRSDKLNRRGFNYMNDSDFRNGTYGYQSYVDRDQYRYYFQQGYQRGYEDGYNNTYRYGNRTGNGIEVLGNVLNTILNLAQ